MKLFVNALGAWVAVRAAEGHYSRPAAVGLAMLVSRLGPGAIALALAGYGLKRLDEAGAFDEFKQSRRAGPAPGRLARGEDRDSDADATEDGDAAEPAAAAGERAAP